MISSFSNHQFPSRLLAFILVGGTGPFCLAEEPAALPDFREAPLAALVAEFTNPNTAFPDGTTPLMRAVEAGRLDVARWCLWAGADPLAKDAQGRTARAYLPQQHAAYAPLTLLVRAWEFAATQCTPATAPPANPALVLIDDTGVDYLHPDIAPHYEINQSELNGRPGIDDDGNGFVDDVHGWNFSFDLPMLRPAYDEWDAPEYRPYFQQWLQVFGGDCGEEEIAPLNSLPNPFNRRFVEGVFNIEPLNMIEGLTAASHGTHVAGIVVENSRRRARLHGVVFSAAIHHRIIGDRIVDEAWLSRLAKEAEDFPDFYHRYRNLILADAMELGKRYSQYIRSTGAGIVNMSYGEHRDEYAMYADYAQTIYRSHGKKPESLDEVLAIEGIDLDGDLGLELFMARSVFYLTAMIENPDVLFVTAAGNSGSDNDAEIGSPDYFAWLLPNVVSVASLPTSGESTLSDFSNYGRHTVQLAAPGENIPSALICGLRGPLSGTSMAAPAVSGIAARIRAAQPTLRAPQLRYLLESTAAARPALREFILAGEVDGDRASLQATATRITSATPADLATWEQASIEYAEPLGPVYQHSVRIAINAPKATTTRITTLAGYPGAWVAVASKMDEAARQSVLLPCDAYTLGNFIQNRHEREWAITGIAGNSDAATVIMEESAPSTGFSFLRNLEKTPSEEYLRSRPGSLAALSGTYEPLLALYQHDDNSASQGDLVFALIQENITPEDLAAIHTEATENGMAIRSIAGDNNPRHPSAGRWHMLFEASENPATQKILGPCEWPEAELKTLQEKGFRITTINGSPGQWVIVLSTDTDLGAQSWIVSETFPSLWIEDAWGE